MFFPGCKKASWVYMHLNYLFLFTLESRVYDITVTSDAN